MSNEENFKAIANFVNADRQIESNLNTNFSMYGEYGIEQTTYEIMAGLRRKFGDLEQINKNEIIRILEKNYGFGVERYMDEYHRGVITEEMIANPEFMLDESSIERSRQRVNVAGNQIDDLCETNNRNKPNVCFGDYTNRSFSDIVDLIETRYGTNMAKQVVYYEQIIREPLEDGLYDILRQVKGKSLNDVAELAHYCNKIEGVVQETEFAAKEQSDKQDFASMFK